jgi:hypothetical protein
VTNGHETAVCGSIPDAQFVEPERPSLDRVRHSFERGMHGREPVHAPLESVVAPLVPERK